MLCAIYKSKKKEGMYKRDDFSSIPETLRDSFGTPIFVMLFNLKGEKSLINADNQEVLEKIQQQGFYLQMPKQEENLLALHKKQHQKPTAL